jgi:hypothetical protein
VFGGWNIPIRSVYTANWSTRFATKGMVGPSVETRFKVGGVEP